MVIQEKTETVDANKVYEIFNEVAMPTADGKSVNVLQLVRTTTVAEQEQRISQLNAQIGSMEAELAKEEDILEEINSL